jgi:hypothetical protein
MNRAHIQVVAERNLIFNVNRTIFRLFAFNLKFYLKNEEEVGLLKLIFEEMMRGLNPRTLVRKANALPLRPLMPFHRISIL